MKKPKFIMDADREQYLKQLEAFNQSTNPKPSAEEREILRQKYLERRNVK